MPKCIDCYKRTMISGKLGLCEDCIIKYLYELENKIDELENERERETDEDFEDNRSVLGE